MSFLSKIFLIFIFTFSISINTFAALGPEEIPELKEKIYYNITPNKPNVGDNVEIEAQMYGTDVSGSNFVWKMADKNFKEELV
jgi:hypothetical protein